MNEADLVRVSRKLRECGFSKAQADALVEAFSARIEEDRAASPSGRETQRWSGQSRSGEPAQSPASARPGQGTRGVTQG